MFERDIGYSISGGFSFASRNRQILQVWFQLHEANKPMHSNGGKSIVGPKIP